MRTITAALLAQAQSLRARAAVRVSVHNKRWRWSLLHWNQANDLYTDMQLGSTALFAQALHRCRVDASGNVQTAVVTVPATQSQWETWTTRVSTGATASSDCAIAVDAASSTNMRIFYADGSYIHVIESADRGATWGSPAHVAAISGAVWLAADHQTVFYIERTGAALGEARAYAKPYGSGSWTAAAAWAAKVFAVPTGIGAIWDPANSHYYLSMAGDGQVWAALYTPATNTWGPQQQIAPGGNGAAGTTISFRAPSPLVVTDGADKRWLVAYVDDFTGDAAGWAQPVVVFARDGAHHGDEVAIACWTWDAHCRTALAAMSGYVYAANNTTVCRAKIYADDDTAQNLDDLEVETYRRETGPTGSRVSLTVLDRAAAWRQPGTAAAGECLQPLAQIVVERGYGAHGHETWTALDPHYITRVQVTHGKHGRRLEVEAVDGLGLLALWSPPEPMTWQGKTIEWLATELCASVGLEFSCPQPPDTLGYAVPIFTLRPGQSGLSALLDLLTLAGAVPWCLEAGTVYAAELYNYGPADKLQIGDKGEILTAAIGLQAYPATGARVIGYSGSGGVGYSTDNTAASMALGLRLMRMRYDARIDNDDTARDVTDYHWTLAREERRRVVLTVPLRPDAELYDYANLYAGDAIPAADNIRRLVAIREHWDGDANTYTSTLTFRDA